MWEVTILMSCPSSLMKTQWWIGTQSSMTKPMSSLPLRALAVSSTGPALMFATATTPYSHFPESIASMTPLESTRGSSSTDPHPIFSANSFAACSELEPGTPM